MRDPSSPMINRGVTRMLLPNEVVRMIVEEFVEEEHHSPKDRRVMLK
jgi:hypothetical protein